MADSQATAVAKAIVADLNAATLNLAVTAVRARIPRYKPEELAQVIVTVVAQEIARERESRSAFQRDVVIGLAVQQLIDVGSSETPAVDEEAACDALDLLTQQIAEFYETRRPTGRPETFFGASVDLFDPDHLEYKRVYTSVITLTFRQWS